MFGMPLGMGGPVGFMPPVGWHQDPCIHGVPMPMDPRVLPPRRGPLGGMPANPWMGQRMPLGHPLMPRVPRVPAPLGMRRASPQLNPPFLPMRWWRYGAHDLHRLAGRFDARGPGRSPARGPSRGRMFDPSKKPQPDVHRNQSPARPSNKPKPAAHGNQSPARPSKKPKAAVRRNQSQAYRGRSPQHHTAAAGTGMFHDRGSPSERKGGGGGAGTRQRYRRVKALKKGGMDGAVNVVQSRRSGRLYVKKQIRTDGVMAKRARMELATLKLARGHRKLNQLIEYEILDNGPISVILEYCDGGSLEDRVKEAVLQHEGPFHESAI